MDKYLITGDALAGIALFLSQLAASRKDASGIREEYLDHAVLKDKVALDENVDSNQILKKVKAAFKNCRTKEIDGAKEINDKIRSMSKTS